MDTQVTSPVFAEAFEAGPPPGSPYAGPFAEDLVGDEVAFEATYGDAVRREDESDGRDTEFEGYAEYPEAEFDGQAETEEESGDVERDEALAGAFEQEAFPSGLVLTVVSGATGNREEHWDPNGVNLPLYDTGPAVRAQKLSPHFTVGELVTSGGRAADHARISVDLVRCLEAIRGQVGRPVVITSGYRSWRRNSEVYGKRNATPTASRHCSGQAADIRVAGLTGMQIAKAALDAFGDRIGVGIGDTYAHIDVRGKWAAWTYLSAANNLAALTEIEQYRTARRATPPPLQTPAPTPVPASAAPSAARTRTPDRAAGRVRLGTFTQCAKAEQRGARALADHWRRLWYWGRRAESWRPYKGRQPHTDHIHVDLSWEGALHPSPLFAGPVPDIVGVPPGPKELESPAWGEAAVPERTGSDDVHRILNCEPSRNQDRDWRFDTAAAAGLLSAAAAGGIAASVDLRADWWTVGNQGPTGYCVGWACADSLLRWHLVKEGTIKPNEMVSPRFVWMASKETDVFVASPTTFIEREGTDIKSALDVLRKFGAVREDVLPFGSGRLYGGTSDEFYAVAAELKIRSYFNLGLNHQRMRTWLATNGPVAIRLVVDETWRNLFEGSGELAQYRPAMNPGGHAAVLVGYTQPYFIVRNSWGTAWGDGGFGYASPEYLRDAVTETYGIVLG